MPRDLNNDLPSSPRGQLCGPVTGAVRWILGIRAYAQLQTSQGPGCAHESWACWFPGAGDMQERHVLLLVWQEYLSGLPLSPLHRELIYSCHFPEKRTRFGL